MDPVEVRHEQVSTGGVPVAGAPVVGAAPVAAAPVAAAPVAPAVGVYTSRSSVVPVGYRASQIVWFVVGLINVILAFDFVFRLLKASDAGFASLIYGLGGVLAAPFDPVFGISSFRGDSGVGIIRWSDLLAIVVYSLIAWGAGKLIRIAATPRETRAPY